MQDNNTHTHPHPFVIVPFCIYHFINRHTNTYYGFINYPTKFMDNTTILKCPPDNLDEYGAWFLYGTFYAISPLIRPIPNGLKLFSAVKREAYPYDTKRLDYVYQFNPSVNTINFITWSQPVPDTVNLYIHISPFGGIFPSFDKNPPQSRQQPESDNTENGSNKGWTEASFSPIRVFIDKTEYVNTPLARYIQNLDSLNVYPKDIHGIPQIKFKGIQSRCMPNPGGVSLTECFLSTDENLYGSQDYARSLLEELDIENNSRYSIKKNIMSVILVILIILILLITLFIIKK
jgi:hypothetical protein